MSHKTLYDFICSHGKKQVTHLRKTLSYGNRREMAQHAAVTLAAFNLQKRLGLFLNRLLRLLRSLFVPASRDQFLGVMA